MSTIGIAPVSTSAPLKPCRLDELPMTEQLFLWTLRHVVCAAEDGRPVCHLVQRFFDDAGLPRVPGLISALLRTLSAAATSPFTVNVPCGVQVLRDEAALLLDLRTNTPSARGVRELRPYVAQLAGVSVAQRLHDVAVQFDVLAAMRDAPSNRAAATVH